MPRTKKKRKTRIREEKCLFCDTAEVDDLNLGQIMHLENITVHYFCMLFSSALAQQGEGDDEGLLGFLPADIMKEYRRGKRLKCIYCKKIGATIGCTVNRCSTKFHLPCGIKHGSMHQFFDSFRSFCEHHRLIQEISMNDRLSFHGPAKSKCSICLSKVAGRCSSQILRAPCCKNAWFHRKCLQEQALNAGYFFKCPLCNNKEDFQTEMLTYGIYIPERDASWELEANAFQDLLYRHNQCDANVCECDKGRDYNKDGCCWEVILCKTCGSQGIHIKCGKLNWRHPRWECTFCGSVTRTAQENEASSSKPVSRSRTKKRSRAKRRRSSNRQIKGSPQSKRSCGDSCNELMRCDSESDVDVITINEDNLKTSALELKSYSDDSCSSSSSSVVVIEDNDWILGCSLDAPLKPPIINSNSLSRFEGKTFKDNDSHDPNLVMSPSLSTSSSTITSTSISSPSLLSSSFIRSSHEFGSPPRFPQQFNNLSPNSNGLDTSILRAALEDNKFAASSLRNNSTNATTAKPLRQSQMSEFLTPRKLYYKSSFEQRVFPPTPPATSKSRSTWKSHSQNSAEKNCREEFFVKNDTPSLVKIIVQNENSTDSSDDDSGRRTEGGSRLAMSTALHF